MSRSAATWSVVCLTLVFSAGVWADPAVPTQPSYQPTDTCENQLPGDANGDGIIDREDVIFLFEFLCDGGPAPTVPANGDPNGDCVVDSLDLDYLMDALAYGGPAPVTCTCDQPMVGACYVNYCIYQHPGDVNGDGAVNIGDAAYLGSFLNHGGSLSVPLANLDVNGDCIVNLEDYSCLISIGIPEFPCRVNCTCIFPALELPCGGAMSGDANNDGQYNVGDAVYIVNYVFRNGPAPVPYAVFSGDPNGDCRVNVGDAVFMINRVFSFGPAPVDCYTWLNRCGSPVH
jgi:hypothetical protein